LHTYKITGKIIDMAAIVPKIMDGSLYASA
jgi:hypothetical protein